MTNTGGTAPRGSDKKVIRVQYPEIIYMNRKCFASLVMSKKVLTKIALIQYENVIITLFAGSKGHIR